MAKYLNLDGLQTLWAKLKDTFLGKSDFESSPAGKILEVEYGSSTYTYQQLKEFYKAGYTVYVVSSVDDSSGSAGFNKLRMVGYNDVQSATPTAYFFSEYNPASNASTVATLQIVNGQERWNSFVSSLSYNSLKDKAHTHTTDLAEITASEGTSNVTDNTMLVTSDADGYSSALKTPYRRKATRMWDYIKGKLTSDSGVNVSGSSTKLEIAGRISASGSNFHDAQYALVATSADAGSAAQISCYRFNNGSSSNNSPFGDGMVINIPWSSNYGVQIAIEDSSNMEYKRYLNRTWTPWVLTMTSDGHVPSAQELYRSDRGNFWFVSLSTTQVYRLTMPANKDCGLASLFVHTTATNGWPLIFQVGWRWQGDSFSVVPHLAYIYTTSQSSEDKKVTVKYSGDSLYICINQTQTQRRALFSLISDNVDSIGFDIISQNLSDYTQATSVAAGNTEGCVMKENIGSAIGSAFQPTYISASGFVKLCNFKIV